MAVNEVGLHMNAGDGETSYANNSAPQKIGISKALHVLDEALKDMAINDKNGFSKCFKMADLGCSSGPNTLSVVSHIIDKIQQLSNKDQICPDEFQVFLNDLPGNDFNNLFKLLPQFYHKLDHHDQGTRSCFVSGVPGSFYGRLFPSQSLDLVYSSYSLHWLSQVPQGLEGNRGNIHLSETSPPEVFEAYREQFYRDLSIFLSSRGEELVPGGRMVLTFPSRNVEDLFAEAYRHDLMANTLADMVLEGVIKEADLHAFNIPIYPPSRKEVEEIVGSEGSFSLDRVDEFALSWDVDVEGGDGDVDKRVQVTLNFIRAVSEPVLAAHFVSTDVDEVFERYRKKLTELRAQPSCRKAPPMPNMVISLTKK